MCLNVLQVVLRSKTYNGSGKDSSGHDDSEESIQSLISNLTKNLEVRKQHVVLGLPQQTRFQGGYMGVTLVIGRSAVSLVVLVHRKSLLHFSVA